MKNKLKRFFGMMVITAAILTVFVGNLMITAAEKAEETGKPVSSA